MGALNSLTLDGLALDPQHQWTDEFEWDAVEQEQSRSLNGKLIVQEGVKLYGRPVTLEANEGAWTPLSTVRALEALRDERGRVMLLELPDGRSEYVIFNRGNGAALQAQQLFRLVNPPLDDLFELTLRLITVAPPA